MVKPQVDRPKVLIVEDAEDLLDVWLSLLRLSGKYVVKAVSKGTTAVELVRSGFHPNVLITDFFLGDANGIQVADQVRSICESVGVIVATGNNDNEALAERAEAGEIELLIKPVRFRDLTASIDELLQRKGCVSVG
ncbi:response regulator [Gilvimarinus sp. F26214L]|uniref:response regulator n=1 Tax=Gilvimarinus sp. DZF01 TaxID=3461371 RepID=UPI004045379F